MKAPDFSIETARSVLAEETARQLGQIVVIPEDLSEPADPNWRKSAACLSADPEVFFAPTQDPEAITKAKQICGSCAVRAECLQFAFTNSEPAGVWGGMDGGERGAARRRILRQRREAKRIR